MRAIFLLGFFVLVVFMHFGSCEGVDTTIAPKTVSDSELAEIYKKNVNDTVRYLGVLVAKYNNFPSQVEKLKDAPPKPFPKILDLIHENKDYIELKAALDEVWPWVWKVPRRRRCAEELEEKVQELVDNYNHSMDKNYKESVQNLIQRVKLMKYSLLCAVVGLKLNRRPNLEDCGNDRYCDMAIGHLEEFKSDIEHVENALNLQSDYFKGTYGVGGLGYAIKERLVYPVNVCLDLYYQRPKKY